MYDKVRAVYIFMCGVLSRSKSMDVDTDVDTDADSRFNYTFTQSLIYKT